MMKKIEGYYNAFKELDERYDLHSDDEKIVAEIQAQDEKLNAEIMAEGEAFSMVYRMYRNQMDRGNTYIDLGDLHDEEKVAGMVDMLRKCGIQFFTFASGWSGSAEMSWEFIKNGCQLCGMMEINGSTKIIRSSEYKKVHGYLFKTF